MTIEHNWHSLELTKIILERIDRSCDRRITFAEFMDIVLYDRQYGYYSSGMVNIGASGDFFTSSSLCKDFGELLAIQFIEMWDILERPSPFYLVEIGAGNGNLTIDVLNYIRNNHTELSKILKYIIIEKSPELIDLQQQKLNCFSELNIVWKSWEDLAENSLVGCCFSNELIDAFPCHLITIDKRQLKEIYLTERAETLTETLGELSTAKISTYFDLIDIELSFPVYQDGYRSEVNLAALDWLQTLASKLNTGYLLTIDYGYPATKYYHPQRNRGTLQCYYRHRRHYNPYINLGYQDITSHIDFTALERQGELSGLNTIGFTQQALFLMALGLGDRLNELSSGRYNFKEVLQRRDALHQLIEPTGLGGFGVLIQGKNLNQSQYSVKGLTFPI
jgi:SAM-dependent MidA family methyltransferase